MKQAILLWGIHHLGKSLVKDTTLKLIVIYELIISENNSANNDLFRIR